MQRMPRAQRKPGMPEAQGSAVVADNFFMVPADELLNQEKVRYSPGMDTLQYPEQYPYAYRYGFQSTGNRASAKISGTGFDRWSSLASV